MGLNLIADPWIPVRRLDGSKTTIAPWQMADPDLAFPDWPRADLNIACLELLIGLVFLADPPADPDDWDAGRSEQSLRQHLEPYPQAFEVFGDGPRFLQDLAPLDGAPNPPDMMFIDSAGANAARNNADLLVHRDRYGGLDPALAAMALYTLHAFAPSGGAGNRTSMRGGGPMVTLVDPGQGLWPLIWANVPYGAHAPVESLPWMRPTRTSDGNTVVWPHEAHPVEAFFGMPRRLRLVDEGGAVTGIVQRPNGTNYSGWVHPLTPYYRQKPGAELLPAHPRAGGFGYRNWLGVTAADPGNDLHQRAAMVAGWQARGQGAGAQVLVAGWSMDKMKPRDFIFSRAPLIDLAPDRALLMSGLVEAANLAASALRGALKEVLAEGEARDAQRERFFSQTQAAFEQAVAKLTAVNADPASIARDWLAAIQHSALKLFEEVALPGLAERTTRAQEAVVRAHRNLRATLAGRSKPGATLFGALELPVPEKSKEAAT
tara:strand:- start:4303 stop:5769 length:1467 start_codon:yes stop_codon:yes gene_type:complete